MKVVELPIEHLRTAPWNANVMDEGGQARLKASLKRYGLVQNLVVRKLPDGTYEVLSGNQRLKGLRDGGTVSAPCVVVKLSDADARLLSQALNRIGGEDDLGLRAQLLRSIVGTLSQREVLSLLPETPRALEAISRLGQEDLSVHLAAWQQAQSVRLNHMTLQFSNAQLELVGEALELAMKASPGKQKGPNRRGIAMTAICEAYLDSRGAKR